MKRKPIVLTASSMACLFSCARKYYLSYVLGWRKRKADDALRFGTAFHKGLEVWFDLRMDAQARKEGKSEDEKAAIEYDVGVEALSFAYETAGTEEFDGETQAQLAALLFGYFKKWGDARMMVEPEREFAVRFKFLPGVVVCGKMDGIVTLESGVKCLIEHKTTGEDISPLGEYWGSINRDQVALYKAAAEKDGMALASVIYDVIRKPTIRQGKDETAKEYQKRLAADCVGEQEVGQKKDGTPKVVKRGSDFYFARREIPLLDCDMDALARRLFAARAAIRMYRKLEKRFADEGAAAIEAWPRCGSAMVCRFCPFRGVCGTAELPETEWEKGRMFEELTVARKWLA